MTKFLIGKVRKFLASSFHLSPGFTMIELLVVIAVIGVLAVAVLASIDPIEQINKGRDTRKRSNAAQLINAEDRFYAIQERYTWNHAAYNGSAIGTPGVETLPTIAFPDGSVCAVSGTPAGFCAVGGPAYSAPTWLQGLSEVSEVKVSFVNQLSGVAATNILYVAKAAEGPSVDDSVYVCFTPASKQFQLEAIDNCVVRSADLPAGACAAGGYTIGQPWVDELICLP